MRKKETRMRTKKWGLAVYQQAYQYRGELKYSKTWYYTQQVSGKRVAFPLGMIATSACKLAESIYLFLAEPSNTVEEAVAKFNPRKAERVQHSTDCKATPATIGNVIAMYLQGFKGWDITKRSSVDNVCKLRLLLRRAEAESKGEQFVSMQGASIDYSRFDKLPVASLTLKSVKDMQASFLAEAEDVEEELRAKRNANSVYQGARSVFAEQPMEHYEAQGLQMPDRATWQFLSGRLYKKTNRRKVMSEKSVVEKTFEALPELKVSDPNAYRAFMVAAHCSLRRNEMGYLKWSWFRVQDDRIALEIPDADGDFRPKGQKGRRIIVENWVYRDLLAMRSSKDDYLVEGDEVERLSINRKPPAVVARLTPWLKAQGVTERLPYHNLRSWWFSAKVKLDGLLAASQQGGHEDPKTTSDSYADNEMPDELLAFWRTNGKDQL